MPFFLGFSTIGLFIAGAEWYVTVEYAKDDFPADLARYSEADRELLGLTPFTPEERRALALVAVDYLQRPEPAQDVIYLLEEQRLPGTDRPLYNASEISHMVDVKRLTDAIGRLNLVAAAIVLGGLALLLARAPARPVAYRAIMQGGLATTALLVFIALFIALAWNVFFVQFHELLFPPGTWTFSYSDSLIRLFPEKFWFDFGLLLSLTALGLGLATTVVGYGLRRRFGG
jgi:integral membrane protein (TIGR01906 family)